MWGCHLVLDQGKGNMLACKDFKKQFSSVVNKIKIGFHVVNFNEKKIMWTLFQKDIYRTEGFIPTFSYMLPFVNSQYQSEKNFVRVNKPNVNNPV